MTQHFVEIGDANGDSQNSSRIYILEMEESQSQLMDAYDRASKMLGLDIISECCVDFGERNMNEDDAKKLTDGGIPLDDIISDLDEIGVEEWIHLFIAVCRKGDPSLGEIKIKAPHTIGLGGFGLIFE